MGLLEAWSGLQKGVPGGSAWGAPGVSGVKIEKLAPFSWFSSFSRKRGFSRAPGPPERAPGENASLFSIWISWPIICPILGCLLGELSSFRAILSSVFYPIGRGIFGLGPLPLGVLWGSPGGPKRAQKRPNLSQKRAKLAKFREI